MNKEDLKIFEGKNIKIIIQNDFQFNGYIEKISDDCLNFKDGSGDLVLITFKNIKFIRINNNENGEKK